MLKILIIQVGPWTQGKAPSEHHDPHTCVILYSQITLAKNSELSGLMEQILSCFGVMILTKISHTKPDSSF